MSRYGLYLFAVPVGILAAGATWFFKAAIHWLNVLLYGSAESYGALAMQQPWYFPLITVSLGGLVAGAILQLAVRKEEKSKGPTDYLEVIDTVEAKIPVVTSLVRCVSSLISIVSGASIGREGAMIQLAALVGSVSCQWTKFSKANRKDLIAMAAAGGLAAVYHTPLAAAVFVFEVAFGFSVLQRFTPLLLASLSSVLALMALGDYQPIFSVDIEVYRLNPVQLSLLLVVGLGCGLTSKLIAMLITQVRHVCGIFRFLPARLGFGGLLVGAIAIVCPNVTGNGYEQIVSLFEPGFVLETLLILFALKILATAVCIGSGSVGGLFTPALLIGGVLGGIVALSASIVELQAGNVAVYICAGMAALLGGISKAPLTSILMIVEMTGSAAIAVPAIVATLVSLIVATLLRTPSSYPAVDKHATRSFNRRKFDAARVADLTASQQGVSIDAAVLDVLRLGQENDYRHIHVVSSAGRFLGAVSTNKIRIALESGAVTSNQSIQSFLDNDFPYACSIESVQHVWSRFADKKIDRIPVVDGVIHQKYLGVLYRHAIADKTAKFL
jgi:CIC family chloride channel protein